MKKSLLVCLFCVMAIALMSNQLLGNPFVQDLQAENNEKRITAEFTKLPLNKVLRIIQKDYGFSFAYDGKALKSIIITASFDSASITEVLDELCRNNQIAYQNVDGTYVLYEGRESTNPIAVQPKKINFTIEGRVLDLNTREPLPFANVREENESRGSASNVEGYFTLREVSSDTALIVVSYIGYRSREIRLHPDSAINNLRVFLKRDFGLLPEVTVFPEATQSIVEGELPGISSLNMATLDVLPNIGETDIVRAFQLLPGISGTTESNADFHVRGGASDENLILLDGFTLYHVDHFYGLFSGFNSNSIKNARIHKGVLSAEFGGRGSSVLELTAKNGNILRPNTQVDLGLMSLSALIESPILANQASMMLSFRRSFSDILFSPLYQSLFSNVYERSVQSINQAQVDPFNDNPPSFYFYDVHFKVGFETKNKDRFALSFYSGEDQLDLFYEDLTDDGRLGIQYNDQSDWGNIGVSGKWSRQWNPAHFTNATLGYSSFQSELFGFDVQDNRFIGFVDTLFFDRNTRLDDATLRLDHTWTQVNHEVKMGLHWSNYDIRNSSLNQAENTLIESESANFISLYTQDTWRPNERWEVLGGMRLNSYSKREGPSLNPRLLVKWMANKRWSLHSGIGLNEQVIRRLQRQNLFFNTADVWALAGNENEVPVLRSRQINSGISWRKDQWKAQADVFWVMKEGVIEDVMLLNGLTAPLSNQNYLNGTGNTYGAELLLKKEEGKHSGWLAYTFTYNLNDFNLPSEDLIPSLFNQLHEFKAIYLFRKGPWKAAATWVYGSGIPTTDYLGTYQVDLLPNQSTNWPGFGALLGSRLPAYHRLDLSGDYGFSWGGANVFLGLSVFNVYDRLNVRDQQFYVSGVSQSGLNVELSQIAYLGFTPSLQISVKW
ncbi:MAG: TonB-dependent receptor [Flavobacteriales bacterium]|nr:TonB-dependent receptor [Flavobacteriales bacterium]